MPHVTLLSKHGAEHAIVERLLRASMDVHSALSLVGEKRTVQLLRQVIDDLDHSIKQVQSRALDFELQSPRDTVPSASPVGLRAPEPRDSAPAAAP